MSKTLGILLKHWTDKEAFRGEFGNLDLPFNLEAFCVEMDIALGEVESTHDGGRSGELKPCPFCGGPVMWCDEVPDDDGGYHECEYIHCPSCKYQADVSGADSGNLPDMGDVKELAKRRWNTRA